MCQALSFLVVLLSILVTSGVFMWHYPDSDLQALAPLLAAVVAVGGWYVAHWLNEARDLKNKRHDFWIKFLIGAYQRLEDGCNRGSLEGTDFAHGFESALRDIQLLGTNQQVELAKRMVHGIAQKVPNVSAGPLLLSLRDELRKHLGLQVLGEEPLHFRLSVALNRMSNVGSQPA